jgi:predicted N-acyltransferase
MPENTIYDFKIYNKTHEIPNNWDLLSVKNIFLSVAYFRILENSAPENMTCHYIALFKNNELVGVAICQIISSIGVSSSGEKKNCFKSRFRDFAFKKFASNVLLIGNNMLTGQNAYCFSEELPTQIGLQLLLDSANQIKKNFEIKKQKINITSFKDFDYSESKLFKMEGFNDYYKFDIQPNMVFDIPENWNTNDDYFQSLSKKYRDQYKRSHKKVDGIIKKKLSLEEIEMHIDKIHELYLNVTKNAPFNTFYLAKNHFIEFKKQLGSNFLFYGYFIENELIGFNTLIKNGTVVDTYFLGYNDDFQKEKMLYLNMLYDMVGYTINKQFEKIIFARTALEIKSSVGAKPIKMFGMIKHHSVFMNRLMPKLFDYFEPEVVWQERNPFK